MSFSFIVEFSGEPLIDLPVECIGLSHLKKLKDLVNQDIPLSAVAQYIWGRKEGRLDVELDEKRAVESGHFIESGKIRVKVTNPKSFNKYVTELPTVTIDSNGIRWASIERKIDYNRILEDWVKAGYPKNWQIQEV